MSPSATHDIREALCEVGRRLWNRGLVASNDGNLSYRLDERTVLCTPTMMSKGSLTPEDLVLVDLDGNQVGGTRRLTSEIRLHLHAYRRRPDLRSVVHAHPPHAVAFAIAGESLPKGVLPEVEVNLGEVPVVPYRLPGTWEFACSLDPWIGTHDALLLEHHGAVAFGADPFDAYYRMETLEQYCRILILVRQLGGEWRRLAPERLAELQRLKAAMGLADPRAGLPAGRLAEDAVLLRKGPETGTFQSAPFDGKTWPVVTDEPKNATAPAPVDEAPAAATTGRSDIEREVRRVLGALALGS